MLLTEIDHIAIAVHDLEAAKRLLDQGILTEDEFQSIKKKYISKL